MRYLGGSPEQHDVCPISLRGYLPISRVFITGYEAQFTGGVAKSFKLLTGIWRSSYHEQFFSLLWNASYTTFHRRRDGYFVLHRYHSIGHLS